MKNITQGQKEQYKEITKDLLKTTTAKNQNLHKAKQVKNDEFYTQIEDIEKELQHYKQHLKGKVVYCNCDDPEWSNFFGFFSLNFKKLGLKKLITTHYTKDSTSYKVEMIDENEEPLKTNLKGDGDFRSNECIELLKEADIVVTNPPFSLFREFIDKLTEYNKKFLIIGGKNALVNKNTFQLFKENKIRTGITQPKFFITPLQEKKGVNACWFTNLEHGIKKEIKSIKTFKGNEGNYPKYDNYDAIEVSILKDIPIDYNGIMGVPITYLEKHDPEKYEIIATSAPFLNGNQKYKRVFIKKIESFFYKEKKASKIEVSKKELGQYFTNKYIVEIILNEVNYVNGILYKKILEPSFGEGIFLIEIYDRLINKGKQLKLPKKRIESILENNVFGIELDKEIYLKTKQKLSEYLEQKGFQISFKNLYNLNFLEFEKKNFDYIVGNPPYVRIHNLDPKTKELLKDYKFCSGNTDLYIAFFEKSIEILNEFGKLCFITPNSFFKNSSQKEFRKFIIDNNFLEKIIDCKEQKMFSDADTYTAITVLNKNKEKKDFTYNILNKGIIVELNSYSRIEDNWYFGTQDEELFLKDMNQKKNLFSNISKVNIGLCTSANSIYILNIIKHNLKNKTVLVKNDYDGIEYEIETAFVRKTIKANKESKTKKVVIFPYFLKENKFKVYEENDLKIKFPLGYKYLLNYQNILLQRDIKSLKWYEYGRKQGLSNQKKIVINNIFKDKFEVKIVDNETLIYSGIYITSKFINEVKEILESKTFFSYAHIVGKNLSGGFKSISSSNIKNYKFDDLVA